MRDLGTWDTYVPETPPAGAPPNTIFWKNAVGQDWYEFRASTWAVDTDTLKVLVVRDHVVTMAVDPSMLGSLSGHLYELDAGSVAPNLGDVLKDGNFVSASIVALVITQKIDIALRMTDAEGDILDAAFLQAPGKLKFVWQTSSDVDHASPYFQTLHDFIAGALTQAGLDPARADALLAPST